MQGLSRGPQLQIVNFRLGRKHTRQRRATKGLPRSRYVRRLGRRDQLVEYSKPISKPKWMYDAAFASLPDTLRVRELRFDPPQKRHPTPLITLFPTPPYPIPY